VAVSTQQLEVDRKSRIQGTPGLTVESKRRAGKKCQNAQREERVSE
jgi:hypothetical protein